MDRDAACGLTAWTDIVIRVLLDTFESKDKLSLLHCMSAVEEQA